MEKTKKRVSTEWDKLIESVKGDHSKRFNEVLATLDDEDFAVQFPKILEYVIPKLQRVENTGKEGKDNEIRIIHVTENQKYEPPIDENTDIS